MNQFLLMSDKSSARLQIKYCEQNFEISFNCVFQVKVREATSNDPWGPSSTMMSEIADLTYNVVIKNNFENINEKRKFKIFIHV